MTTGDVSLMRVLMCVPMRVCACMQQETLLTFLQSTYLLIGGLGKQPTQL